MQQLVFQQKFMRHSEVQQAPELQGILLAVPVADADAGVGGPLFRGQVRQPLLFRDLLLWLSEIVNSRFYRPDLWRYLDPVVTAESTQLRLECFSSCASVYGRVDLQSAFFDGYALLQRGSTNVNFQPAFVQGLSRLRPGQRTLLEVGQDFVQVQSPVASLLEQKVKLPERWVKGFLQSQALFRQARLWGQLPALSARQFLLQLKATDTSSRFLRQRGAQLDNLAQMPMGSESLPVEGLHRLSLLRKLVPHLQSLAIYQLPQAEGPGPTLWVAELPQARVTLALSSSVKAGFSGEGEALRSQQAPSATEPVTEELVFMRHLLASQEAFTADELALQAECSPETALSLLDQLAHDGLLGFDVAQAQYFYRVLPFVMRQAGRLQAAQVLQHREKVSLELLQPLPSGFQTSGWVEGQQATYATAVTVDRGYLQEGKCSCQWAQTHGLRRGPCKHMLALRFQAETQLEQAEP